MEALHGLPLSHSLKGLGRADRARASAVCPKWRDELAKAGPLPRFSGPLAERAPATDVKWSPTGDTFAIVNDDGPRVFDAGSGAEIARRWVHPCDVDTPPNLQSFMSSVAYSRDGALIVAATGAGVAAWRTADWKVVYRETTKENHFDFGASRTGIVASDRRLLRMRDDGPPETVREHAPAHVKSLCAPRISPDGESLAMATDAVATSIADVETGAPVVRLPVDAFSAAWSPDGGRLLTVANGSACAWDVRSGKMATRLFGGKYDDMFDEPITPCVCDWSRNGAKVVTAGGGEHGLTMWTSDGRWQGKLMFDDAGPVVPTQHDIALERSDDIDLTNRLFCDSVSFSPDSSSLAAVFEDAWYGSDVVTILDLLVRPLGGGCVWDGSR